MADADAVRAAGLQDRLPADPSSSGAAPAEPDQAMTLVDHLSELRTRIVRAILAVVAGSAIGFYLAPTIRAILVAPLPIEHRVLQVLGPGDAFAVTLRSRSPSGSSSRCPSCSTSSGRSLHPA